MRAAGGATGMKVVLALVRRTALALISRGPRCTALCRRTAHHGVAGPSRWFVEDTRCRFRQRGLTDHVMTGVRFWRMGNTVVFAPTFGHIRSGGGGRGAAHRRFRVRCANM
jgi:hypothetical protein